MNSTICEVMNCTDGLGQMILVATEQNTGSIFITLLLLLFLFVGLCMLFGLPMEYTIVVILPLLLVLMGISGEFIAVGAVIFLYLAVIITKNFILVK